MSTLSWYGAPATEKSLNEFRYKSFIKAAANMKPDLSTLPPTEGPVKQHAFRTYHQVQMWLGEEPNGGAPNWERKSDQLVPELSCIKSPLNCSVACLNCRGSCNNGVSRNLNGLYSYNGNLT
ncbi:unnamed protein product [Rotaria socialis]|uniref:Uncharacterized protein n=1 Tax=Rotaria socialis TaxID=392032 RepID=A0A818JKM7_9BILA|nr:unnamed protein product [Rotaria socialis]